MNKFALGFWLGVLLGISLTIPSCGRYQSEKVFWADNVADSMRECIRRGVIALACYDWNTREIIIWRHAPLFVMEHERCHRDFGWVHPNPMPEACKKRGAR